MNRLFALISLAIVLVGANGAGAQVAAIVPADYLSGQWKSTGEVDWNVAAVLGLLSKTAYEDDDELMSFVAKGMGFKSCRPFRGSNSAAHVLISDKAIVVAFRGTEFTSLADWKTDLNSGVHEDARLGKLHKGFNDAYDDVRWGIETLLRQHPEKQLWVTGHSLGGAMAVICAARCLLERVDTGTRIVTFGQPRVGKKRAAVWLNANFPNSYQRFANDNDIVPSLPPTRWMAYSHAGRFVHLDRGRYRNPNMGIVTGAMLAGAPMSDENVTFSVEIESRQRVVGATANGGFVPPRFDDEVYQPENERLPVTMIELEQLVAEEEAMRKTQQENLYFPDGKSIDRAGPRTSSSPATVGGVRSVGSSMFSKEKITDHFMVGYIEIIRAFR